MRTAATYTLLFTLVCSPVQTFAGKPPSPTPRQKAELVLKNVELSPFGSLSGQLIDRAGQAASGQQLRIQQGETSQIVTTNAKGQFKISNLVNGQCVIHSKKNVFACRVWQNGSAPPKSLRSIALVDAEAVVRGQMWVPQQGVPMGGPVVTGPPAGGPILGGMPLPTMPMPGSLHALTAGQKLGLGVLALGGAGLAIAASQDDDDNASF